MSSAVIKIENLWKEYRLGVIGHGTLTHDLQSWWAKMRGKEDPNAKVNLKKLVNLEQQVQGDLFWALRNINLEIHEGEILGVIGSNGAGKSTLLKILSRVTAPTRGTVKVRGRIASLLEVGTGFHPELTGRENIFLNGAILGMSKGDVRKRLDEIINFSGVAQHIDTPVKRYSSGMYVRLAFAVAAHLEPEILVVDEVLAVGDAAFQKKCLSRMQDVSNAGRTVLFVSHNMSAMVKLCSRIVLLNQGMLQSTGKTDEVISNYLENVAINKRSISGNSAEADPKKLCFFTDSWICDASGQVVTTLENTKSWFLGIKFHVCDITLLNNMKINVVFSTLNGVKIGGVSNSHAGYIFKTHEKDPVFYCKINGLMLNRGMYFYKLEVIINGVLEDRIERAGKIMVSQSSLYEGGCEVSPKFPLLIDHTWLTSLK